MNKEFIPYEQALALKELGFDEPCFGYYEPNGNFGYVESHIIKDMPYLAKNSEWQDLCSAPTFSQAFRFFREKYGLRIRNYVFVNYSGGISEGFEIFKYSKDTIDRVEALTYEEAELACLIKLIEIVKQ